ncbi:glycosyltransferase family 4 protein [Leucobacter iarius]|uniref:Glycosyltransferase family 4 protein n=1 Tax=Leucobacter iarius TaxID=333963 RepID=A0ABN2LUL5_9MICO
MLTVALFTHSARPSGAELFILRIASAMHTVRPLVVLGEHGPMEEHLSARGVETLVLPLPPELTEPANLRTRARAPRRAWHYARELGEALRHAGVDVLYTHSAKAHLLGGLAGRLTRIPVVSHAHDLLGPPARGRLGSAISRGIFAVLPQRRIANSDLTRRSAGWASRLPWEIVPCPVELPLRRAAPRRRGQEDGLSLLVLGRLTEWKGQDLAIRALASVLRSGRNATLDLVGDAQFAGDVDYRSSLEELARSLGVSERVRFRGHSDDPGAALRQADIVLHTSLRPEPFGQVVLEAMAEGRATIVADSAGVVERLTPGGDCLIYSMGDADALASAIATLIDSPSERKRLGRAARWTAEEFTSQQVVPLIERALHGSWQQVPTGGRSAGTATLTTTDTLLKFK